jgi:hypothetical protein
MAARGPGRAGKLGVKVHVSGAGQVSVAVRRSAGRAAQLPANVQQHRRVLAASSLASWDAEMMAFMDAIFAQAFLHR